VKPQTLKIALHVTPALVLLKTAVLVVDRAVWANQAVDLVDSALFVRKGSIVRVL